MTNIVKHTPKAPGLRPAEQTRELSTLIARFTNRLEETGDFRRKCISVSALPTDPERQALGRRRGELNAAMEPDSDRSRRVLVALLGSFPSYGEDEETGRFILSACCRACSSVPAWALEEASARFLEGRNRIPWNMANRPTPPQILAEAKICLLPLEEELFRISQVLDAEVVDIDTTPDERREALEHWDEIRRSIVGSNVISQRTDAEIAKDRADMRRANERFEGRDYTPMRARRREELETAESGSVETGEGRG